MESGENPGDKEDKRQKSKSLQSEDKSNAKFKVMIKIPTEYLSEKQKKILGQKSPSKEEPSTSSDKDEGVFKVPQVPPLRKKETSPSKVSSDATSKTLSATVVQTAQNASLEESIVPNTVENASLDEDTKNKAQGHNLE